MSEKAISVELVAAKILLVRGRKVMLDKDLAKLYGVKTSEFNQAVQRNLERFPADFMYQLTREEFINLKSQIVISSWGGMRKHLVTAAFLYLLRPAGEGSGRRF